MAYKSDCRACGHAHDQLVCNHTAHKIGTIRLRSYNNSLFGVHGGFVNNCDSYGGQGQMSTTMAPFQMGREESFEYNQEVECGCRFYVPSENLEFVEWKYNESNSK